MTDRNRLLVAAAAIAIGLCAAPFALQGNRGAPGFDADAVRGDVHVGAASGGFASGEGAAQAGTSGPARSGFTDAEAESRPTSALGAGGAAAAGETPTDVPAGMTRLNATVVFEDGTPVGP
ncbi:MAG TPA: hypothetical protein VEI02_04285, partial [Planctomycetota bacterium]|nr:hypothetical protein [Planctomycetota bacterium]